MAHIPIESLVPDPADLLELEIEELAGVLLVHLNSDPAPNTGLYPYRQLDGRVNHNSFFTHIHQKPPYRSRMDEVRIALKEAWGWLQSSGFLVLEDHGWYFLSRRAKRLTSLDEVRNYQNARLLPKDQIHPQIATRVYPAFLRGAYDTAIFEAFREVEIAVRNAGGFPPELTGVALMMEAFKVANAQKHQKAGTLTDNRWRLGRHSRRKSMLKVATLMLEVATLFVLTLTLGTIIWYTIETWRLRRTAQQQIRIALDQQRMSVQPVVILEFDRKLHKQHGMPKVCNIGIGPAFNSKIRSIGSSQAEIRFEPIALLKPSAELDIEASVYRNGRYHQRLRDGKAFVDQLETLSTAQVDLAGVEPVSRADVFDLRIEYDDSIGNHYVSEMNLLCDILLEETSIRFVSMRLLNKSTALPGGSTKQVSEIEREEKR